MLSLVAARELFEGFARGLVDPAAILAAPLVTIDTVTPGEAGAIEVPPTFPAVVVAVGVGASPPLAAGGPDVALTGVTDPPRPWVSVTDAGRALAALAARVAANPMAAVMLAQVLRGGQGAPVETGLLIESMAYSTLQGGPEFARWRAGRPPPEGRPDTGPALIVRRYDGRLDIVLDRPEVHNAYNRRMRDDLYEALAVAAADPDGTVRLSGNGPSFCSGGDLAEFGTVPDPATGHLVRTARSPARLLDSLSGRTDVVLHGSCAGSGIELPAFADMVRARPDTRIWLPEIAMGLIPGAGGTVSLPRRIGAGRTAWLALSGETIGTGTARRWGLVDEVLGQSE